MEDLLEAFPTSSMSKAWGLGTGWAMLGPREPGEGQQEMVTGEADRAR